MNNPEPVSRAPVKLEKFRDLTLARCAGQLLAFACDSSGSVGGLPEDEVQTGAYQSGIFMVKVPLMEILASGAVPVAVYADFCYGPSAYNDEVLHGIRDELASVGVDPSIIIKTYGTAKEPQCSATGATVVGQAGPGGLQVAVSRPGDRVYTIGRPHDKDRAEGQLNNAAIKKLRDCPFIHEILPCGSHGFRYEANTLARSCGLQFEEKGDYPLLAQAEATCGACACAVFTLAQEDEKWLQNLDLPFFLCCIGTLKQGKPSSPPAPPERFSPVLLQPDGSLRFRQGGSIVSGAALSYGVGIRPGDTRPCPTQALSLRLLDAVRAAQPKAAPFLLINNLNLPMRTQGQETIEVLRPALRQMGVDPDTGFTGSTEDNHPSAWTGMALRLFGWKE